MLLTPSKRRDTCPKSHRFDGLSWRRLSLKTLKRVSSLTALIFQLLFKAGHLSQWSLNRLMLIHKRLRLQAVVRLYKHTQISPGLFPTVQYVQYVQFKAVNNPRNQPTNQPTKNSRLGDLYGCARIARTSRSCARWPPWIRYDC